MASSSSAQVYDEDDYEVYEDEEDEEEEGGGGGGGGRSEGEEEEEEEEEEEVDAVVEERQSGEEEEGEEGEEGEEEEEWALLSSSPSPQISRPRAHIPSAPTGLSQNHTHTQRSSAPAPPVSALQCSPECSMDDDSSTDASEEHDLLPPPPPSSDMSRKRKRRSERRHSSPTIPSSSSPPPPSLGIAEQQQLDISPATTVHQRKVQIKNLELKFQKECRAHCRTLIALQQQWRQELESPLPGLINGNYLHQQELYKQNGGLHSQTDIQMQNSIVAAPKSRVISNYKHSAAPAIDDATSTKDKAPRRWYDD